MSEKKLMRSSNQQIAGVCAGLAEYFGWNITNVRIVYAVFTLLSCTAGVLIYLILWFLMPDGRQR